MDGTANPHLAAAALIGAPAAALPRLLQRCWRPTLGPCSCSFAAAHLSAMVLTLHLLARTSRCTGQLRPPCAPNPPAPAALPRLQLLGCGALSRACSCHGHAPLTPAA